MSMTPIAQPDPLPNGWHFPRRAMLLVIGVLSVLLFAVFIATVSWPENGTRITDPHWASTAIRADSLNFGEPERDIEHRVWLVKLESGEILALYQVDPHLGCTVPWRPDFVFMGTTGWFRNPCHGETYDLTGYCYMGPCPRGLDRYETRVVNGKVEVRIGEGALVLGPERTTLDGKPREPVNPPQP